jgi:hypothetical protein
MGQARAAHAAIAAIQTNALALRTAAFVFMMVSYQSGNRSRFLAVSSGVAPGLETTVLRAAAGVLIAA